MSSIGNKYCTLVTSTFSEVFAIIFKIQSKKRIFFSAENITLRQDISSFCRDQFDRDLQYKKHNLQSAIIRNIVLYYRNDDHLILYDIIYFCSKYFN